MTLIQIPGGVHVLPGCKFNGQSFNPAGLYTVDNQIRTPQGTVDQYDVTYPGIKVEPAETNYLLATATPATQTTGSLTTGTYTLWVEGTGSAAVTAGTATIADNGTATEGAPNTFTVSVAGTVVVTVTGDLTFFQLENKAFPTSHIPTTDATVTRPADNISFPTPSWLLQRKNDFAVIQRCISAAVQDAKHLLSSYTDANNELSLILTTAAVTLRKRAVGTSTDTAVTYTHAAATLFEVIAYSAAALGAGIALRSHNGTAWSDWSAWTTNDAAGAKANAVLASTVQIGAQTASAGHCAATYHMTRILRIPTNLSAAGLQAWLKAKAEEGD